MGLADVAASMEARQRSAVLFETWGQLYPKAASKHSGYVIFAITGYSDTDGQPLEIQFSGLDDSPMLYQHVNHMTVGMACDSGNYGPKLAPGIYRWSGEYRVLRDDRAKFQKGKLHLLVPLDGKGGHVGAEAQIPLNRERWLAAQQRKRLAASA